MCDVDGEKASSVVYEQKGQCTIVSKLHFEILALLATVRICFLKQQITFVVRKSMDDDTLMSASTNASAMSQ